MRYHLLIVIILILLLLPQTVKANTYEFNGQSQTNTYESYSFDNLSTGSHPSNASWISFGTINRSSTFNDVVSNTSLGRGLDVYSSSYYHSSYLLMNISENRNFTLLINFSWNDGSSNSLTKNIMEFNGSGGRLFNASFGPNPEFETTVSNLTEKKNIGPEPPPSSVITMRATFYRDSKGFGYLSMEKSSLNHSIVPIKIGTRNPLGSNLALKVGGNYCNITIYSISLEPPNRSTGILGQAGSSINYNSTGYSLNSEAQANTSSQYRPYLDLNLNSVIYYTAGRRLASYDFYNMSTSYISGDVVNIHGGLVSASSLYYWSEGSTLKLFRVNLENLSLSVLNTSMTLKGSVFAISENKMLLFYNETGWAYDYNISTGATSNISSLSGGASHEGYQMLSASLYNNTLHVKAASNERGQYITSTYGFRNLSLTAKSFDNYSFLNSGVTVLSTQWSSDGLTTLYRNSYSFSQDDLATRNGSTAISGLTGSFSTMPYSGKNFTLVTVDNNLLKVSSGKISSGTNVVPGNNAERMYATANLSEILLLGRSGMELYYTGSSIPLSNSGIKVTGNSTYLLRGTSFVNVSIESSIEYYVSLNTSGYFYELNNSTSFLINSTVMPEGPDQATVLARNRAGFTSEMNITLVIDNGQPELNMNPRNGSYIANSTELSFSVSDSVAVSYVKSGYGGISMTFLSGNGSFELSTGNKTGQISVYLSVEDIYGLSFNFTLEYNVVGYRHTNKMSLFNGEYLSSTGTNLSWNPMQNATQYYLHIHTEISYYTITTRANNSQLNLENGNDSIALYAELLDNRTVFASEVNVTVITYGPSLQMSKLPYGSYSLNGNSNRSSFETEIKSNITARITASVTTPDGITELNVTGQTSLYFNTSRFSKDFVLNGIYAIRISAVSMSGTGNASVVYMHVNNTIPSTPVTIGVVYTNKSETSTGLLKQGGLNYSATISLGKESAPALLGKEGLVQLPFGQGLYNLDITDFSLSGNHNSTTLEIYYFNETPIVRINVERNVVVGNSTVLNYSITDQVPLYSANLTVNGTSRNLEAVSGSQRIYFSHNGLYNISLSVEDRCGNSKKTANITVNVSYYIHLKSPEIISHRNGNEWVFSISAKGNGLSRVSVTWYVNGRKASQGQVLNTTLGIGVHTVAASLKYQGKSASVEKRVIVTGAVPYVAVPSAVAALILYRAVGTNRDTVEIRKVILENLNGSMKDTISRGRRIRATSSTIKKEIYRMQREGKLSIERDPDGNRYVMEVDR